MSWSDVLSSLIKKTKDNEPSKKKIISLSQKIDNFMNWYGETFLFNEDEIIKDEEKQQARNLIEKMAVWYELRYPEYEINRLMPCSDQEQVSVSEIMFTNNPYITGLLPEQADTKELDWDEFYNSKSFIQSLPWKERCMFMKRKYDSIVFLNPPYGCAHLYLNPNGIVEISESVSYMTKGIITDEELINSTAKQVVELFKARGIELPVNNELEKNIRNSDNYEYRTEELLNCVMYRIIERGGNRIGPRRGFLFAKEFKRDIDIPMMFGIDRSDPGLRLFVNEYIKAGGNPDLGCYIDYFFHGSNNDQFDTITIRQIIKNYGYRANAFYTPEEAEFYQRLIDALNFKVESSKVRKKTINPNDNKG